jgi:hypothetical protein
MEKQYKIPGFAIGGTFDTTDPTATDKTLKTAASSGNLTSIGLGTPTIGQQAVSLGIGTLSNIASGKGAVTESLYNQAASQLGGAQTAAIGAAKQEAAQAGYGQQAIGATAQTAARNMEGERSKLMGSLASATQGAMQGAATQLIGTGQQERAYQDTQKDVEWNRSASTYDPTKPEELKYLQDTWQKLYGGPTPSLAEMQDKVSYARTKQQQDITAGALSIEQTTQNLGKSIVDNATEMINKGWDIGKVNDSLPTDKQLTPAEYDSIYKTTSTYQWNKTFARDETRYQSETEYKHNWDAFTTAAQYGSAADAAAAYKTATGKTIDPQVIVAQRAMTDLGLDAAKIANDTSLRNLASANQSAIVYMANNNFSLDQINASLPAGATKLTADDLKRIQTNYTLDVEARNIANLSASTQVQILQNSVSKDAWTTLQNDINAGVPMATILGKDYTGTGKPTFPNLTQEAFDSMGRERTIKLATDQASLNNLIASTGSANITTAVGLAKSGLSAAQINAQLELTGDKAFTDADVENLRTNVTPETQWQQALAYNDPTTDAGKEALTTVWTATHPGQATPDFDSVAFTKYWTDTKAAAVTAAGKTIEAIIGDIADNTKEDIGSMTAADLANSPTVKAAKNNATLRSSIATNLGIEDNPINRNTIDDAIESRLLNSIKGDVPILVDKFISEGRVPDNIKDSPDLHADLKRCIQDMLNDGIIDAKTGEIIPGKTLDLPWKDPKYYFNYTDWNGKDITNGTGKTFGSDGKPLTYGDTKVTVDGNGSTYQNASKKSVTFKDMDAIYNTLSESDKQAYFNADGTFNTKQFMSDHFSTNTGVGGGAVLSTVKDIGNYFDKNPTVLNTIYQNINGNVDATGKVSNQFQDTNGYYKTIQDQIDALAGKTDDASVARLNVLKGKAERTNQFQYWDANGNWQSESSVGSNTLIDIWQQFSQYYGKDGSPLTTQQFMQRWNNGKGWVIDNGIVQNFKPDWQTTNNVTKDAPALTGDAWTKLTTSTTPIPTTTSNGVTIAWYNQSYGTGSDGTTYYRDADGTITELFQKLHWDK